MTAMSEIYEEYGEALFTLGLESDSLDKINGDLDFISEVFAKTPEYAEFLQSPSIPKAERIKTINETFSDSVSEYAVSFLSILCEKGRVAFIEDCINEFKRLYAESKNISAARVYSAVPLSDGQKERLKSKLENRSGHSVKTEYLIDETLLGGVLIEMDGTEIDGTLKRRLQELKEVMDK